MLPTIMIYGGQGGYQVGHTGQERQFSLFAIAHERNGEKKGEPENQVPEKIREIRSPTLSTLPPKHDGVITTYVNH